MSRETFRILSVTNYYDLWILTDKEVDFYNLFYAFIAVIFAQSQCFTFWIDRPKKVFDIQKHSKTSIVNDQRVLNWNFLSWFSRVGFAFGIMFGTAMPGSQYVFTLYPDYIYVFVLIIIVLFFQAWTTIRLRYKRKSIKWMLVSMVIVTGLSFGLSKVNLIDYDSINTIILGKNMHSKLGIDLPEAENCHKLTKLSLVVDIYIGFEQRNQERTSPVILINNKEVSLKNLQKNIRDCQSCRASIDRKYLDYQLHVHPETKMSFLNEVFNEFTEMGIFRIGYAVVPSEKEFPARFYQSFSFNYHLFDWNPISPTYSLGRRLLIESPFVELKLEKEGLCAINGVKIDIEEIEQEIITLISYNPDYAIRYYINDSVEFSEYFKVLSYSRDAIIALRNTYSRETYGKSYNELYPFEDRSAVLHKYPSRLFEMNSAARKILEDYEGDYAEIEVLLH